MPWLARAKAEDAGAGKTDCPNVSYPLPVFGNLDTMYKAVNLSQFKGRKFIRKIRIAILDNGFNDYNKEFGVSLPADSFYSDGSERLKELSPADQKDFLDTQCEAAAEYHGTMLAKFIAQVFKASGADVDYHLDLLDAWGPIRFRLAVQNAIQNQDDIILYAQTWSYGGNGDGQGFIDAIAREAIQKGILWINAAGDFGKLMRAASISPRHEGGSDWVKFADGPKGDGVTLFCRAPAPAKCTWRLVLSWNDWKEKPSAGTDKDLDLFLFNSSLKQVAKSTFNQYLVPPQHADHPAANPREVINVEVAPGAYKAKVLIKSHNFSPDRDRLWLSASGSFLEMKDPTSDGTVLPPADLDGVFVVGATDDPNSSRSTKLNKPDILLPSKIPLKNDAPAVGNSVSAALATAYAALAIGTSKQSNAGIAAEMRERFGGNKNKVAVAQIRKVAEKKAEPKSEPPRRVSRRGPLELPPQARARGPVPPGPVRPPPPAPPHGPPQVAAAVQCLRQIRLPQTNESVRWLLGPGGGVAVDYQGRPAIFIVYNFEQYMHMPPRPPRSRLFITDRGATYVNDGAPVPPGFVEVVQSHLPVCGI